ncbi:hypothetical protein MMC10_004638 [Thelotrema lepadinum]|nr:hypothetical protein [Thelotrema lepadinum]
MVQGNHAIAIILLVPFTLVFLVGLCLYKLRYRAAPTLRTISLSPPPSPGPVQPQPPFQEPLIPNVRPNPRQDEGIANVRPDPRQDEGIANVREQRRNGNIANVRPPARGLADINVRD